ncbi:MAG: class I SAM-dependent methyltransferase [Ginsengibacter sp.]
MDLSEIIQSKIESEGPVSFHDFMEMALYYPSLGYYNSGKSKIGKEGDFYTSPIVSSLFGELIGKQIEEMWTMLDKKPFTIVEYGAGTGSLCNDILCYLRNNPMLYAQFSYCIIEKGEALRKIQQRHLREKVSWYNSISEIAPVNGCVLSNELLDNFAVHRVKMEKELMEIFLNYDNGFREILRPASPELKDYLNEQHIELAPGYVTEINLEAIEWIKEISENLEKGFALTIDYGYAAEEFYNPARNSGTIVCYKNHQVNTSFYTDIGSQDITAHVNFSALSHWGKKAGLECSGFTTQANFLRSLGLMNYLRNFELRDPENNRAAVWQIQKLLMDMGTKFKVLIQQKNVKGAMLTGIQFGMPL